MGFLHAIRLSASGLAAQRLRMDVISNNVANVNSTRGADGDAFKRQVVSFRAADGGTNAFGALLERMRGNGPAPAGGVTVNRIDTDTSPGRRVLDPTHPDADADGFIETSNVDLVVEMTDMVAAVRAYEANVTVLNASKSMAQTALQISSRG